MAHRQAELGIYGDFCPRGICWSEGEAEKWVISENYQWLVFSGWNLSFTSFVASGSLKNILALRIKTLQGCPVDVP